jgi:hypothetical protein
LEDRVVVDHISCERNISVQQNRGWFLFRNLLDQPLTDIWIRGDHVFRVGEPHITVRDDADRAAQLGFDCKTWPGLAQELRGRKIGSMILSRRQVHKR